MNSRFSTCGRRPGRAPDDTQQAKPDDQYAAPGLNRFTLDVYNARV
ncbi:MAG: hypothetical protein ACJ71Y_06010 [Blastococcus sp.]